MDECEVHRTIARMAYEILEKHSNLDDFALVGVLTRGDVLAGRLAAIIEQAEGVQVPIGHLDISLYRDDLAMRAVPKVHATDIPFDINGMTVVLADDVLFTGRTARAALGALADLGRPACVQLAVLVDRKHRQLPIQADFIGRSIPTSASEVVQVCFSETDGCTRVEIGAL